MEQEITVHETFYDLPSKIPAKKHRADNYEMEGEYKVKPIAGKLPYGSNFSIIGRYVDNDTLKPGLCAVYHDFEYQRLVACNGHYLICLSEVIEKPSKLILPKTGEAIDEKFPDYVNLVPYPLIALSLKEPLALLDKLRGIIRTNKFVKEEICAAIKYDDQSIFFWPEYLMAAIEALVASGSTSLQMEIVAPNRGAVIRDTVNGKRFAIVMPVMIPFRYSTLLTGNSFRTSKEFRIQGIKVQIDNLQQEGRMEKEKYERKAAMFDREDWKEKHLSELASRANERKAEIEKLRTMIQDIENE